MKSNTFAALLGISMLATLAACQSADRGYYDANGNYIAPANAVSEQSRTKPPFPGGGDYRVERPVTTTVVTNDPAVVQETTTTTTTYTTYDRPGYYDYRGYYIEQGRGPAVPSNMLPPRGMCRVWFPERLPENQPGIESCDGIHTRVPAGAYVIFGG